MKRILVGLISLCLMAQYVESQEVSYKTNKLKEIANQLPIGRLEKRTTLLTYKNKDIVVQQDELKRVNHVGIKLFDRRNADRELTLIFDFLERYLLELYLTKDRSLVARKLKEDKVILDYGNFFKLDQVSDDLTFNIVQQDDNKYYINWKRGNTIIYSLSFPIAYELLLGQNKLEMEQTFYEDVMSYHWQDESSTIGSKRRLETHKGQYYIEKGADYFLSSLNANRYYEKTNDNQYTLLFDKNYPVETLANMMLTSESDNNYTLAIAHHKYGNMTEEYAIPLHRWLKYCVDMGCKPYFGIEHQEGDLMTCTVIMVNKTLGYNHILHFTVNKDILNSKSGNIYAKLHTYIPMHNVKDLYHNTNKFKK